MATHKKHRYLRNCNFPVKFILDTDREESEIFLPSLHTLLVAESFFDSEVLR